MILSMKNIGRLPCETKDCLLTMKIGTMMKLRNSTLYISKDKIVQNSDLSLMMDMGKVYSLWLTLSKAHKEILFSTTPLPKSK